VETVYDDSPAERAGLRVGDVVTTADGRSLAGRPEQASTALIKGPAGTDVTLGVLRDGRRLTKKVTRATISIPVVAGEAERAGGERVSHIALATFSSGAHGELVAAIRRARQAGSEGIVFDLRGNGGGLVKEAQLVASAFVADGAIVTTKGRTVPERTLEALGQPAAGKLPTVVLVDGGTASASEIVAGALQDHERATIVGTKTFGKGVFQEVIPLSNGGALDITVGQYYTPDGRNLGGGGTKTGDGITPDVRAEDDPDTEDVDEALQRALDVLARRL
jgi:carboxyl-terminal processing protease